ncbi:MAG: hypothetical protein ACE15E_25095 [Acidobacteriota bacterium]
MSERSISFGKNYDGGKRYSTGDYDYVVRDGNRVIATVIGGSITADEETLDLLSRMKSQNESILDFVKRMAGNWRPQEPVEAIQRPGLAHPRAGIELRVELTRIGSRKFEGRRIIPTASDLISVDPYTHGLKVSYRDSSCPFGKGA